MSEVVESRHETSRVSSDCTDSLDPDKKRITGRKKIRKDSVENNVVSSATSTSMTSKVLRTSTATTKTDVKMTSQQQSMLVQKDVKMSQQQIQKDIKITSSQQSQKDVKMTSQQSIQVQKNVKNSNIILTQQQEQQTLKQQLSSPCDLPSLTPVDVEECPSLSTDLAGDMRARLTNGHSEQNGHEPKLTDVDAGVSILDLTSHYAHPHTNHHLEESSNRRTKSDIIPSPVSIKSLKSTFDDSRYKDHSSKEKDNLNTGVSLKDLMASYCKAASASDQRDTRVTKEVADTGVSIRSLYQRAFSVGDLTQCEDDNPPKLARRCVPKPMARAKSQGDLSDVNRRVSVKEEIHTGVSVRALKASYCSLAQLRESPDLVAEVFVTPSKSSMNVVANDSSCTTIDDVEGVKVDKSRLTRTFSQEICPLYALLDEHDRSPGDQDKTSICRICEKQVFQMEKIKAEKSVFHKTCFRCKECSKQLTQDNYSSHEGQLFCKLHFKILFQPKAVPIEEQPVVRRKPELIIKENIPAELPPDVVRSTDKPSYGLEDLPSLRNTKSMFESDQVNGEEGLNHSSGPIKRSDSILNKMAKFHDIVDSGENGHYQESDSSEGEEGDEENGIIKESRRKEKLLEEFDEAYDVAFQGLSDLKSQWENLDSSKEDRTREKQEDLTKLRMKICHGKKSLYESALEESSQTVSRSNTISVEGGVRAQSLRHRFETGELNGEAEDERYESLRREKEEDLSVVKEPAIANDARCLFKQIDAEVSRGPVQTGIIRSPTSGTSERWARQVAGQTTINEADIIRPSEISEQDVVVETRDVSARFRFFENYTEIEKDKQGQEKKRFTITPPRDPATKDGAPDCELARDPNVVRSGENEEVIVTDTARKMLNKFRELETQAEREEIPQGPKPVKRITPPREFTREDEGDGSGGNNSPRDPNIVRACDKVEDEFLSQAAHKAKNLRAKFEHWEDEEVERENRKNAEDLDQEIQPDRAKLLRAQFESLQDENSKPKEKVKPKMVNRFV